MTRVRIYQYVGRQEFLETVAGSSTRKRIQKKTDVMSWMEETRQQPDEQNEVVATFIVDENGCLWIADRHSEHIACAGGRPVLSAGEITFRLEKEVEVSAITNQSTGFCPEPESWPEVEKALKQIGFSNFDSFTTWFHFRRCNKCKSINIVKEAWFVCSVCDAELDIDWNFESGRQERL